MPCIEGRVMDWMCASMDRIASLTEQCHADEQVSSREAFWPDVRARIQSAREEIAFLRMGNELFIELREALINGYRERNRDLDESIPVRLTPGNEADVPVPAGRLSVGGEVVALLDSFNGPSAGDGRIQPLVFRGATTGRTACGEMTRNST